MHRKTIILSIIMATALVRSPKVAAGISPSDQNRFIGLQKFSEFTIEPASDPNQTVLLSPAMKVPAADAPKTTAHGAGLLEKSNQSSMAWNELIVSWNADAPDNTWLKVEARGIYPDHTTKFYTMGIWARDDSQHERTSISGQRDSDGRVNEDTLVLKRPGPELQLRVTLAGPDGKTRPKLKFLGLSFHDNNATPAPLPPRRAVWGKIIDTPELSQKSYPQERGWCSPTSLTMVLRRWSQKLDRPEMFVDVPEVVKAIYDDDFGGTGNWPFNTAYAGSFPGMRAYVARFSDVSELEDWIAIGIPVIISARWDMLLPGRPLDTAGHLTVCIGFTKDGDPIINDPATNFKKGQKVRHIYKRKDVINAWRTSHNTVYLVYPVDARIPADRFGHWDKP